MWIIDSLKEKKRLRNEKCNDLINRVTTSVESIKSLFSDKRRFITVDATEKWRKRNIDLLYELNSGSFQKLRKAENYSLLVNKKSHLSSLIDNLEKLRNQHNEQVTDERASAVYTVIGEVEGKNLDRQQLVAISKEVHTHLVLAGAGTGKTTTIVGLVKYLLGINKYSPDEILVLSFTNASASEMKERLDKETGVSIEASTFHKLGMNIISETNGIKPKISQLNQRQFIKQQLESLMQDKDYLRVLNAYLMRRQFMIRSEFDFKTLQEYQEHLKKNPPVTLKHEAVKSYGEMEIANFLYLNGVDYIYEHPYKIDTRTKEFGQYKPDFYLPKYDIYIEYFGIDKNGNPPAYFQNDYVASMKWKRELHKANHTTMIESYAYENFEGILTSALEKKLLEKGVALAPLSQEEIWKKISEDDANVIDGLVQLIETVINLMKSNRYDIAEMSRRNASSFNLDDVSYLLDVISPIWNRYTEYLKDNDEIDFNDMINIASDYVRDGRYKSKYKMVIVDEYQDISRARYELLKALRDKYDYDLFCVGDDWQSIYRFAGSDIGYIQIFSKYWGASEISRIETTYRFPQRLIDITSGFIMRNPLQLAKNIRGVSDADRYVLGEVQGYTDKYATQFMLNKMDELPLKSSVFLIGRYSFDINMLDGNSELSYKYDNRNGVTKVIYSKRNDLDISYITAHKSKGLQADYVFILNNKKGKMGFPSKIQDSPILDLLLENSDAYPDAEERRLFYVAMTRAKKKVILVTLKDRESDFVKELHTQYAEEMKQEAFICPLCGGKLKHKKGQYGDFFGCENYKTTGCRYTRNIRNTKAEY